jgi:hypothetical protein
MDERNAEERLKVKSRKVLGICIIVGIIIYFLVTSSGTKTSMNFDEDTNVLSFSYSTKEESYDDINIPIDDIVSLEYRESFDEGEFVSGAENKSVIFGRRTNDEFGEFSICVSAKVDACVVITTKDNVIVVNMESNNTTEELLKGIENLR